MAIQRLNPETLGPSGGNYSHVVTVNSLIFIAGQIARDADGELVGEGDPVAQTRQVLENLDLAIRAVGGSRTQIVKTVTYVTDPSHVHPVARERVKFFGDGQPANTAVVVRALAQPDYLVEIEAIAVAQ
jgi:2-iminobutanoate/2-iminopropanoate deaminase